MKKFLFLISVLLLSNSVPVAASDILYGDADGDGILTASDSAYILQKTIDNSYKVSIEDKYDYFESILDVDRDGILTANDSAMVLQKVADQSYYMPVNNRNILSPINNINGENFTYSIFGTYKVFDDKDNGKGVIIHSREELKDFYNQYINFNYIPFAEYMSKFDNYDSSFFENNILVLSLDLSMYSSQNTGVDVVLSGGSVEITTKETTYYPAPTMYVYRIQIMELSNEADKKDISWRMEKYDELYDKTEVTYVAFN